jgi:hypothetical protein
VSGIELTNPQVASSTAVSYLPFSDLNASFFHSFLFCLANVPVLALEFATHHTPRNIKQSLVPVIDQ